ncbi:MAG TPA: peroxiredoxin, partial [Porticoccaceae bacterium]|nr:peroxiredoxin [Porticoccaceae bacterium]
SVNDVFVMAAWGKASNADDVLMLADGNGEFVNLLGLAQDASQWGMGMRSQRFSMIVDNGIVSHLNIDPDGVDKSSAETLLKLLQ